MDFWSMFQETAKIYGLFAALFIALLGWVLYTNNQREQRYLSVIDKLSDNFSEIAKDVEQIKTKLWS